MPTQEEAKSLDSMTDEALAERLRETVATANSISHLLYRRGLSVTYDQTDYTSNALGGVSLKLTALGVSVTKEI